MPSESSPWRYSLWVAGLVAVAWLACFRFPVVWAATGLGEADRPFLDLYALLAGCDATRLGLNPLLPNPLDPYHRPFGFSDWWFELARLGLGREDTLWLGTVLVAVTLLVAVAMVRPANRREGWLLGLLLISPAVLLAVNRANHDLVVFLLLGLGLFCFRSPGGPARALGVILFAVAAVLKYFPLVTLVLLLDFRSRRGVLAGLTLYAVVLLLGWPGVAAALQMAPRYTLNPDWIYAYGAPMLGRDFGFNHPLGWMVPASLMGAWAIREAWQSVRATPAGQPGRESPAERQFICGAAILVGVFFLGVSYLYKFIFAVWLLPWLWRPEGGEPGESRWNRVIGYLLVAVVWLEGGMAVVLNLFIGRWSPEAAQLLLKATLGVTQVATWALVACLLRFLLIYVGRRGRALWVHG